MAGQVVFYQGSLVSLKEARTVGSLKYFNGNPCRYGHIAERFVSSNNCTVCTYERCKKRRINNIDETRAYDRKYQKKLRDSYSEEERAALNARGRVRNKKRYWENPEFYREKDRIRFLKNSGRRREERAGRPKPFICEACGDPHKIIVFDHCHSSGKFRGWVCSPCNLAIGFAKDSPAKLREMANYLEKMNGKTNGSDTR